MTMRLTVLALVSAAVLGMGSAAQAQNRANDPELNNDDGQIQTQNSGAMLQRQNPNLSTTGQGNGPPAQDRDETGNSGNDQVPAGGEGRVNSHQQD